MPSCKYFPACLVHTPDLSVQPCTQNSMNSATVILTWPLAILLAIVLILQFDDPNALARWATILLDDTRPECHGLLEASGELLRAEVGKCVLQADVGPHNVAHFIKRWQHMCSATFLEGVHGIIELVLITTIGLNLARVASHDDEIEILADLKELVVLLAHIVDQLATHARIDHPIGHGDGIIPVAVVALVEASARLAANKDLAWTLVLQADPTSPCSPWQPRWGSCSRPGRGKGHPPLLFGGRGGGRTAAPVLVWPLGPQCWWPQGG